MHDTLANRPPSSWRESVVSGKKSGWIGIKTQLRRREKTWRREKENWKTERKNIKKEEGRMTPVSSSREVTWSSPKRTRAREIVDESTHKKHRGKDKKLDGNRDGNNRGREKENWRVSVEQKFNATEDLRHKGDRSLRQKTKLTGRGKSQTHARVFCRYWSNSWRVWQRSRNFKIVSIFLKRDYELSRRVTRLILH